MKSSVKPEARLHILEQIEDLCADGDVERRNRLVANDKFRIETSARAMQMRWHCPPENSCGSRPMTSVGIEADRAEHLADEFLAFLRILDAGDHQRLGDDVADPPPRVQRGNRILED